MTPCMQKLDRLRWTAGESAVCCGVRLGLRTDDPSLLNRMRECLPPGWRPSGSRDVDLLYSLRSAGANSRPGTRAFNLLYAAHDRIARSMELEDLFEALEADAGLFVADRARGRVFVHAGVVGWRGRAILLPGKSHAGKTTLVAALVRAGAEFYSDEYAVLDARGRVHPYPRPLSVREPDSERAHRCTAADLGGVAGVRPLPVGLIVVTHYHAGAEWRPRSVSAGRAVLALMANTVPARRYPERSLAYLSRAVQGAALLRGARGEAEDVARDLMDRIEREHPA